MKLWELKHQEDIKLVLFLNAFISSVELQVVIIIKEIKISFYLHLRPFSKIKQRLFSEILPAKTNDECKYVLGANASKNTFRSS